MNRPDPHATRAHWDERADRYDADKARNDAYYRGLKACFDQALPQRFRGRVLEVGCGTGQVLASLRPLNGVGIDASARMIEAARRQLANRHELTFAAMDAMAAPGLGEFDAVVSSDVLEHVDDWHAVVVAMVRACRADGLIVISTPNPGWAVPLWVLEKTGLKMPEGPHRFVPMPEIVSELRQLQCEIVRAGTHLLVPADLRGVGQRISAWSERQPILNRLGVIQLVVARKLGGTS